MEHHTLLGETFCGLIPSIAYRFVQIGKKFRPCAFMVNTGFCHGVVGRGLGEIKHIAEYTAIFILGKEFERVDAQLIVDVGQEVVESHIVEDGNASPRAESSVVREHVNCYFLGSHTPPLLFVPSALISRSVAHEAILVEN
jgi:hypothetical protein